MNAIRPRRLCPLEEQEVARKILADRLRAARAELSTLADCALQLDDPSLASLIEITGHHLDTAIGKARR